MNNVSGVQPPWAPKPVEPASSIVPNAPATELGNVADVVEISTATALTEKIRQIPDVRMELVTRVKAEIQAGAYETPERIEIASERLMDDLFTDLL